MAMRLDRMATLRLFHPLRRREQRDRQIPVLMYHSISGREAIDRHPYFETTTTPSVFAAQMDYLAAEGYAAITLDDAVRRVQYGDAPLQKCVVITFDDGFEDFYTHAFPVLDRHRLRATVFLPTAYIGDTTRTFKRRNCMTWRQVRELHGLGVVFGSHTQTHPKLAEMVPREIQSEIHQSKVDIENRLGTRVSDFAYPYAFPERRRGFKRMVRDFLLAAGYGCAATTVLGTVNPQSDPFFLERIPVNTWDDVRLFLAKLEGGYNWLRPVQYAAKLIPWRSL